MSARQIRLLKLAGVLGLSFFVLMFAIRRGNEAIRGVSQHADDRVLAAQEAIDRASSFTVVSFDQIRAQGQGVDESPATDEEARAARAIGLIESAIGEASTHDFVGTSDADVESLARVAAEFVYYRFVLADPDAYIAWRLGRGDRFADPERIYGDMLVALDFEELFGEPLPAEMPVGDVFRRFFRHQDANWGPAYEPRGLAVSPESILILIGEYNPVVGTQNIDIQDPELRRYWLETTSGSHRSWFVGAFDHLASQDKLRKYQVGTVGLTLEFGNGERRTIQVLLRRASGTDAWVFGSLATSYVKNTGGLVEY